MTFGEFRKVIDPDTVVNVHGDDFEYMRGSIGLMPVVFDSREVSRLYPLMLFDPDPNVNRFGFRVFLK